MNEARSGARVARDSRSQGVWSRSASWGELSARLNEIESGRAVPVHDEDCEVRVRLLRAHVYVAAFWA